MVLLSRNHTIPPVFREYGVPDLPAEERQWLEDSVTRILAMAKKEVLHQGLVRNSWHTMVTTPCPWGDITWHVRSEVVACQECDLCQYRVDVGSPTPVFHRFGLYRLASGREDQTMMVCGMCLIGADPARLSLPVRTYWRHGTRRIVKMREMRPLLTAVEWWTKNHTAWKDDPTYFHVWGDVDKMRDRILRGVYPRPHAYGHIRNILTTKQEHWSSLYPKVQASPDSMLAELLVPENFQRMSLRDRTDARYIARITKGEPLQSSELRRQVRRMFDEYVLRLPMPHRRKRARRASGFL